MATTVEHKDHMLSWLRCDAKPCDKSHMASLYGSAFKKHKDSIQGMKNYSLAWMTGSTKQKNNNVVDHANSEQPKAAMACAWVDHARASNEPVTTYATLFFVEGL